MAIFVTGATGFVGGSIAARLIEAGATVRGLVRNPDKAEAARALGIEPVIGTLGDHALLAREAAEAEAVINAADSDDRGAVEAIAQGLAGSGKAFIHTSGTSIVADEAMGEPSERIFDEDTAFTPAPDKAARVAIDRFVLEAPGVRSVVLCNSLIYGHALGIPAESVQLPRLIEQASESGVARYIGRGLNRWSTVHIEDVADLYVLALQNAPAGTFLFVENGESAFRDMVQAIADALGLGAAQSWPAEAAIARWGRRHAVFSLGSNSRVRTKRARPLLGWSPRHASADEWIRANLSKPHAD